MVCLKWSEIGPLQANKKHSFHKWRGKSGGRRCHSPERSGAEGRGSEHGAVCVYAPRRAAQARLTGGADRSSRLCDETNVRKKTSRKAEPDSGFLQALLAAAREMNKTPAPLLSELAMPMARNECLRAISEAELGGYQRVLTDDSSD